VSRAAKPARLTSKAQQRRNGAAPPMVRAAAAMLALCGSSTASPGAAAWNLIARSDDGLVTFYGDPGSIVPHGHLIHVRLLFDYAHVQQDPDTLIEHRSTVELASIDCSGRRIAPLQATSYERNMGKGRAVVRGERVAESSLRFVSAVPASIDDKVVGFACTRRAHRTSSAHAK
jgi:hypothetical protein